MRKPTLHILGFFAIAQLGTFEEMLELFSYEKKHLETLHKKSGAPKVQPEFLDLLNASLRAEWSLRLGKDIYNFEQSEISRLKIKSLQEELWMRELCTLDKDIFSFHLEKTQVVWKKVQSYQLENIHYVLNIKKELENARNSENPKEALLGFVRAQENFQLSQKPESQICKIDAQVFIKKISEELFWLAHRTPRFLQIFSKEKTIKLEFKKLFSQIISREYLKLSKFYESALWETESFVLREELGDPVSDFEKLRNADKYFDSKKYQEAQVFYEELLKNSSESWVKVECSVALVEMLKEKMNGFEGSLDQKWELLEAHRMALNESWRTELRDPLLKSYVDLLSVLSKNKESLVYSDLLKKSGITLGGRVEGLKKSIKLRLELKNEWKVKDQEKNLKECLADLSRLFKVNKKYKSELKTDLLSLKLWAKSLKLTEEPTIQASFYELGLKL